jgi:hypothetical protein
VLFNQDEAQHFYPQKRERIAHFTNYVVQIK